jgi:hypothetical protein
MDEIADNSLSGQAVERDIKWRQSPSGSPRPVLLASNTGASLISHEADFVIAFAPSSEEWGHG